MSTSRVEAVVSAAPCSLAITPNIRHALNARLDSQGVMAACCQQAVCAGDVGRRQRDG